MGLVKLQVGFWAVLAAVAGCSSEAEPRPQLVIVLDTNAPVVGQLAEDPTLASGAAIDTIRVDVIDDSGQPYDFRDFVAPDPRDWPVSFGVAAEHAQGRTVRLRIRMFRGALGTSGVLHDITTIEPRAEVSIDRLVRVELPDTGIRRVRVLMDAECLGVPTKFTEPRTTCISIEEPSADPGAGLVDPGEGPWSTQVGTWQRAREVPCSGPAREGAVCIPGGLSVLGDPVIEGYESSVWQDAVPLRPAWLDPFWMDRTEVTVGEYRKLVQQGFVAQAPPNLPDPTDRLLKFCAWLGADVADNDALPLNCVGWDSAREICQLRGGDLPTEAQWEHAARGGGEQRMYPWGDRSPLCCTASVARTFDGSLHTTCEAQGSGMEPVGSHADVAACDGPVDVSRDGVLDLGGSVSEQLLDNLMPYDHPCWASVGIPRNPLCEASDETAIHSSRGGSWSSETGTMLSSLRTWAAPGSSAGLRCVYPDQPASEP